MSVCFNLSPSVFYKRGDLCVHAHYYFPPILAKTMLTRWRECVCVRDSVYMCTAV